MAVLSIDLPRPPVLKITPASLHNLAN